MTISLQEINRVTLRIAFLPVAERELRALGVPLPTPWNPSDEELGRLADAFGKVLADVKACDAEELEK